MNVELHPRIVGMLLLLLAVLNLSLPKRFRWKEELARLSLLNRQIFIVHCLFIILVLIMMGVLSLLFTRTLMEPTPLAVLVLGGLSAFWGVRLFVQWFVYDRQLWIGNPFHTCVHFAFTGLWTYFAAVYGWAFYLQVSGAVI